MPGFRGLFAAAVLIAVAGTVSAEVKEPSPNRSQGSGAPAARSSDGSTVNITQPTLQVTTPTNLLAPAKPSKSRASKPTKRKTVRKRSSKRRASRKRRSRKLSSEARWWQKTGNPAVFAFRDCINGDVASDPSVLQKQSEHERIVRAMDGNCSAEFDSMAKTLAARFGEKGFRRLSKELIQTTFLPAAATGQ